MKQRVVSFMLVIAMLCSMVVSFAPEADALHLWITERNALKGSSYTTSDIMAQKLEEIFDGDITVYHDSKGTNPVSAPIGSYVMKNNGVAMYLVSPSGKVLNSGTSCWIYAQGVYYTLFEDYVYSKKSMLGNSDMIDFSTTATKNCTYANFKAWGVRQGVGAMLRAAGHSMIVLGYDENKLITLEGNVSNGLVCVRERSWDQVENKYSSFEFIMQPKEEYMQEHYGYCKHETMNGFGECPDCGFVYNWLRTFNSSDVGSYEVITACTAKTDLPYAASENMAGAFSPGDTVEVQGSVINAFKEKWYKLRLEDGSVGYAPADCFQFESDISLQASCTGFQPADQHTMKAASYVLRGTVTSNYPLKKIDAYLDGTWYASWTASNQNTTTVSLQPTNINYKLAFGSLSVGTHVIELKATSYVHETAVTCHKSTFYIIPSDTSGCTHSYATIATIAPTCTEEGLLTYQCEYCSNTYTEAYPELGHNYVNGYCAACGALDVNFVFVPAELQVGAVSGEPGQTVSVPVSIEKNPGFAVFAFTANYDDALALTGVTAAPLLTGGSLTQGTYINWSSSENVTGDGILFYLNFKISENAAEGDYPVSLSLRGNSTWYFRDANSNARDINFTSGKVTCKELPAATVMPQQQSYATLGEAVSSCGEGSYVRLNKDQSAELSLTEDLYIDLNGFDLSGTVTGGNIYGMDSTTDGYDSSRIGYFSCTDESGAAVIPQSFAYTDGRRYAAIKSNEGYSFHRFYLGITHATVKPATEGVGYKAVFAADEMLREKIDAVGFVLQLPGNEPVTVSKTDFVSLEPVTLRVDGYLVDKWGEAPLTAQVYMTIDGQSVQSAACSYSLRQIVELVNDNAAGISAEQKSALSTWISRSETMQTWKVENLL